MVVDSENRPQRGHFLPDSPPHGCSLGQEAVEKGAAAVDLQPTIPKSDRLLDTICMYAHHLHSTVLIPAAGMGERLGLGPKALLRLGEYTLIEILVNTLEQVTDSIAVSAPNGYEQLFRNLLGTRASVVPGGNSRQASIERLLENSSSEVVLIQDVARPFASARLIKQTIQSAEEHGAAGAFLDPTVPVGYSENGIVRHHWDRHHARIFQAPQAYKRDILNQARTISGEQEFQSTAQMVLSAGFSLIEIPGEVENIKITTPFDWMVAQRVIAPLLKLDKT